MGPLRSRRVRRSARIAATLFAAVPLLGACTAIGAPAIPFFGAYFPSWLASTAAGILGAVAVRLVLVATGIDDALPARLPVYLCFAAGIGFAVSLAGFGR